MTHILQIEASARTQGSLSRGLSQAFRNHWRELEPQTQVTLRDLSRQPPDFVTEDWIAAAFTPPEQRRPEHQSLLQTSDQLIAEVKAADIIVIASPMYNYGMPAALKAWFDQVIRVGETFSFDLQRGDWPLTPLLSGKTLVVLSSRGEFGFEPGGIRASWNHLDPHIATCAHYLGAERRHYIAIDYQEFGDHRHRESIARAHADLDELVKRLCQDRHRVREAETPAVQSARPK